METLTFITNNVKAYYFVSHQHIMGVATVKWHAKAIWKTWGLYKVIPQVEWIQICVTDKDGNRVIVREIKGEGIESAEYNAIPLCPETVMVTDKKTIVYFGGTEDE